MSDRSQSHDRVLTLLCQRGVDEILRTMRANGDAATFAQLALCGSRQPGRLLRALAAERLVSRPAPGSWDANPHPEATFALTSEGAELAEHLERLADWAALRREERDQQHRILRWLRHWIYPTRSYHG